MDQAADNMIKERRVNLVIGSWDSKELSLGRAAGGMAGSWMEGTDNSGVAAGKRSEGGGPSGIILGNGSWMEGADACAVAACKGSEGGSCSIGSSGDASWTEGAGTGAVTAGKRFGSGGKSRRVDSISGTGAGAMERWATGWGVNANFPSGGPTGIEPGSDPSATDGTICML